MHHIKQFNIFLLSMKISVFMKQTINRIDPSKTCETNKRWSNMIFCSYNQKNREMFFSSAFFK